MNYKQMLEKAKSKGATRTITATYHKFTKKGETLVGRFVAKHPVRSTLNESTYNQYLFDTDQGRIKFAMGAQADLEVGETLVKDGIYEVIFDGSEKISGGRQVKRFIVNELTEEEEEPEPEEEVK